MGRTGSGRAHASASPAQFRRWRWAGRIGFWPDQRASVAVEFALAAPILILLSLGMLEVGRALLARHDLSLATFEAGRYAMVHSAASSDPATTTSIKSLVAAQFPGIRQADLKVTAVWTGTKRPGDFVTITLEYPFSFLIRGLPTVTLSSTITVILVS